MKTTIIVLGVLTAVMASSLAAAKTVSKPTGPNPAEFAYRLVLTFGGQDKVLDEDEVLVVMAFLQNHLPESTHQDSVTRRMISENNFRNSARGDMTEERHALRHYSPEECVSLFLKRYDLDKNRSLTRRELTPALAKVIGLPSNKRNWGKRAIAKR